MGVLENINVFKMVFCNLSFFFCNDELINVIEVEIGFKIVRIFMKLNKKFILCMEI